MPINIKKVAQESGVSISTVSRVLNNTANVNADKRKLVEKAIEKLGYRKNRIASNLRMRNSNFIGLVIPDNSNEFFSMLAKSIELSLREQGYTLFLCNSDESSESEIHYLESLIDTKVDGIVLISADNQKASTFIDDTDIPIILIDRFDLNSNYRDGVVCIESDNFNGAQSAANHLITSGCERIVFLQHNTDTNPQKQRRNGFISAMIQAGRPESSYQIEKIVPTPSQATSSVQQIYRENPFDALFCSNDRIAFGALKGLREIEINVPEQVQVIGFDGIEFGAYTNPALSTIKQDVVRLGQLATENLISLIKKEKIHHERIVLPTEYVERDSTR